MNSKRDRFEKQLLIKNVFESKQLFLTILRFTVPTFFFALFSAAYVFIDQIMVIKFVPRSELNPDSIFTDQSLIDEFKNSAFYKSDSFLSSGLNIKQFIKTVLNISQPLIVLLNAINIFIPLGTGVIFSKAIGRNDQNKIQEAWNTGLISTTVFGLITQFLVLSFAKEWLHYNLDQSSFEQNFQANSFQQFFNKKAIDVASEYVYILIGLNIIPMLSRLFFYLAQSEGRQLFIAIVPPIANLINILIVFLLVRYSSLGVIGSAVAGILGYLINFLAYIIYLIYLNKRNLTYLTFKTIKLNKIDFNLLVVVSLIGMASFFRNGSLSIVTTFYESFLVNLTKATTDKNDVFYLTLLTGPIAISNLASAAIFGLLQGVRTVSSYKFGQKKYDEIKKINIYTVIICISFGSLIYLLTAVAFGKQILSSFFDVSDQNLDLANYFSLIVQAQVFFVATGANSQQYFQNTNRVLYFWIVSLTHGLFVFIPLLFIFQAITLQTNNIEVFIWLLTANAALAGLINIAFGQIHTNLFMDKYFANPPQNKLVKFIEKYS